MSWAACPSWRRCRAASENRFTPVRLPLLRIYGRRRLCGIGNCTTRRPISVILQSTGHVAYRMPPDSRLTIGGLPSKPLGCAALQRWVGALSDAHGYGSEGASARIYTFGSFRLGVHSPGALGGSVAELCVSLISPTPAAQGFDGSLHGRRVLQHGTCSRSQPENMSTLATKSDLRSDASS